MDANFSRRSVFTLTGAAFAIPAFQSNFLESGPMPFTPKFVDLVRNMTSVTGTGPVTLGQAVNGYTSLAAAVSPGDQFYYCIQGVDKPTEREIGRGTMQSDGKVARQPVLGAATNFTTGTKTIALVAAAEWFSKLDGSMPSAGTRAELAAKDGATGGRAFLGEQGRAGNFVFDLANLSTKVAADPAQGIHVAPASDPSGASGAWVRRFDGSVNVRWFGATGDGTTNDGAAFTAAIAALREMRLAGAMYGYSRGSPKLFVPAGHYFLGTTTLDIFHSLVIEGEGGSGPSGGTTVLRWSDNTTGIRLHSNTSAGATGSGADRGYSAVGSILRGLMLIGAFAGTESESHGVHLRVKAKLEDIYVEGFGGDGIYGANDNINGSTIIDPFVLGCRNGIYLYANDANALAIINPRCFTNRRYGIWMKDTFGSSLFGGDMSSNGQVANWPTMVSHSGRYFWVKPGQEAGAATNAPPTSAASNDWWQYVTTGEGAPTASRPAWANGIAARSGGCLRIEGPSSYATVIGMYRELDQAPAQVAGQSVIVGGLLETVDFAGNPFGGHLKTFGGYLTTPGNFDVFGSSRIYESLYLRPDPALPAMNSTFHIDTSASYATVLFKRLGSTIGSVFGYYGDSSVYVTGAGGVKLQHDSNTIAEVASSGFNLAAGKVLKVNAVQVVGAQGAAVGDAAGGPNVDAEARAAINALLARCRAHGLIA